MKAVFPTVQIGRKPAIIREAVGDAIGDAFGGAFLLKQKRNVL